METEKKELTESDLGQFTGTEEYHKHQMSGYIYTDGVEYMAEQGGAYWLLDAIFSYRRTETFQVWELKRADSGNTAVLTMKEDSDKPILVTQDIEYTDFPLDSITLWLINGVLILPSEY